MAFLCSSPPSTTSIDSNQVLLLGTGSKLIVASTSPSSSEFAELTELTVSDKLSPVVCACVSSSELIAAATESKELGVWKKEGEAKWSLRWIRILPKRAVVMRSTKDGRELILADKIGEVYLYSLEEDNPGVHLLGHFSILLDVVLSPSNGHVITCDRDEKIRVSRFPNSYNIETFCLGHTEFVSSLSFCPKWPHLLISGSGDGTVKVWDWKVGRLLDSRLVGNIKEDGTLEAVTKVCCCFSQDDPIVMVMVENSCQLLSLCLTTEGTLLPCSHGDGITLTALPWDITFDWSDRLWVCLNDQSEPVVCYQWKNHKPVKILRNEKLQEFLCKRKYFEGIQGKTKDWSGMRKQLVDNMGTYLARKEERIKSKKKELTRSSSLSLDEKKSMDKDSEIIDSPPTKKTKPLEL